MPTCLAPAKINLALHVIGQRPDGMHLLDTVAVFADIGDMVSADPAERLTLAIEGPLAAHAPIGSENLIIRAAECLRRHTRAKAGAALRLTKHLPSGAGFGGGSADAAAALLALNELWQTGMARSALAAIGVELGADIPMCVSGAALRARGIGEVIDPISGWPPLPMVLIWPGAAVPTGAIFSALEERVNEPLPPIFRLETVAGVATWLAGQRNDLQHAAVQVAPVIHAGLEALRAAPGCLLARMSGSGSGCFGLFASTELSRAVASRIASAEPSWWVCATVGR